MKTLVKTSSLPVEGPAEGRALLLQWLFLLLPRKARSPRSFFTPQQKYLIGLIEQRYCANGGSNPKRSSTTLRFATELLNHRGLSR